MPLPKLDNKIFSSTLKRIQPIIKSRKSASYFTLTATLFSLSFFGLFAIRPALITAVSLIKSVEELRDLNKKYETKINSVIKAQSEYEKIRDALPLLESAIPTNPTFTKLALALEKFADKSSITIQQLHIDNASISDLPHTGKVQGLGFGLLVSGDNNSLSDYILHLLNYKRLVTIESLNFSKEGSTNSGILQLTIKGSVYYEP